MTTGSLDVNGIVAPVVYETVADQRLAKARESACVFLRNSINRMENDVTDLFHQSLVRAYAEGVRDGFQQGVAAECERRESTTPVRNEVEDRR